MPVVARRLDAAVAEVGQGIRNLEVTVEYEDPAIWNQWVTVSTSATTTINVTWNNWTTASSTMISGSGLTTAHIACTPIREPERSAEEVEALMQRRRERAAEVAEQERLRVEREEAAEVRATELLRSLINDEQWEQWERFRYFDVDVRSGRRYRIHRGVAGNVRLLEDDVEVESLCCHPSRQIHDPETGTYKGVMPVVDVVVGQLLALRFEEERFREVANISNHRGRLRADRAAHRVAALAA